MNTQSIIRRTVPFVSLLLLTAFLCVSAFAQTGANDSGDLYGGIEVGSKGIKATAIRVKETDEGHTVKLIYAEVINTTLIWPNSKLDRTGSSNKVAVAAIAVASHHRRAELSTKTSSRVRTMTMDTSNSTNVVTVMATLAPGGRISDEVVVEEIERLRELWAEPETERDSLLEVLLEAERLDSIDLFDRLQLTSVLKVCRASATLSEAGRTLFATSREKKKTANDADRLRKYLARFGLCWQDMQDKRR